MSQKESRKTPRQRLSVPVRISGHDAEGRPFIEEASTLVVNWNGALIATLQSLGQHETLYVVNQQNGKEAKFRVVGEGASQALGMEGWGLECLNPDQDFWDLLEARGPIDPFRYDA